MTAPAPLSASMRTRLGAALATWLPGRRWFAAKDRAIDRVELVRVVGLGRAPTARGLLVVAAVHLVDEPRPHYYQLPIGLRWELSAELTAEVITSAAGTWVYDATADPELMALMLELVARGTERDGIRFATEGDATLPGGLGARSRRIIAEQSNTSVVFGDQFILKFFRRLFSGENPEVEVHRALGLAPELAALAGVVEGAIPDGKATFAVLHEFVPSAVPGWELATEAARDPAAAPGFAGRMRELGGVVASVHSRLADRFGSTPMTRECLTCLFDGMRQRLGTTVSVAPVLRARAAWLTTLFDEVERTALVGSPMHRVHGDLHLGQVLDAGRWLLIDFEGEPGKPVAERIALGSPLQDVAGVLRSIDYAAGQVALTGTARSAAAARDWARTAGQAFRAGYAEFTGRGLDPALLRAYELDKAIYELGYEIRNRPGWAAVPLRAIEEWVGPAGKAG